MTALRIHLALLELERGDPVLALEHAEQAYKIAAGSGDAPGQAVSRAIQAGATGITGDPEEALRLFGDAARGLRTSPSQYEYAEILRMWGEFLLDLAQLEPAIDKLTAAHEVFKKLGAAGRMRLVADSLTAIGAGPASGT
jgi:tetratricopeptide (TPR) repeat protein